MKSLHENFLYRYEGNICCHQCFVFEFRRCLKFRKEFFDSVKMPLVTVTFKTRACTLWVNTCCIEDAVY